jgi:NADH dehydrogenase (ubiquinone) 1 alpha subcomplex subunit 6
MAGPSSRVAKAGTEALTRYVSPIISSSSEEARANVLAVYKEIQRLAPTFWFDYDMKDMPLPVFRDVLKKQFVKNAHLTDVRVIDRIVEEAHQHIKSVHFKFYNKDHVRNFLFRENLEPKPKDFLSRFLTQKE